LDKDTPEIEDAIYSSISQSDIFSLGLSIKRKHHASASKKRESDEIEFGVDLIVALQSDLVIAWQMTSTIFVPSACSKHSISPAHFLN
jgi:hypothetical protein